MMYNRLLNGYLEKKKKVRNIKKSRKMQKNYFEMSI